jgi:hypothetical protein
MQLLPRAQPALFVRAVPMPPDWETTLSTAWEPLHPAELPHSPREGRLRREVLPERTLPQPLQLITSVPSRSADWRYVERLFIHLGMAIRGPNWVGAPNPVWSRPGAI